MQLEFQVITPDYAAELLANHNPNNRPLSRNHVTFIAQEMERGTFRADNGDSIRFGADGNIIDGQHRLAAIVRSGKTVMMLVARGIEGDAFATIDIGKSRSISDIVGIDLRSAGINTPRGSVSSARLLLEYESRFSSGATATLTGSRRCVAPVDMVRATCRRPGFIDAVERAAKIASKMMIVSTAPMAVALIACELDSKAACDAYLHRLQTMEGLQPGAPEHSVDRALRTWKIGGSTLQRSAYGQLFALLRGYIASRDGRQLNMIRIPLSPETFVYLPTK
jgi:hypothetical protein